jgi:hypothetical protein
MSTYFLLYLWNEKVGTSYVVAGFVIKSSLLNVAK